MIKGIDISVHQGPIDFKAVKKSGISFVIPRCSIDTYKDRQFDEYVKGAKEAGLDVPAVYYFSHAHSESSLEAEVKTCLETVKGAGLPGTTIIFFDYEDESDDYYTKINKIKIQTDTLNMYAQKFCDMVKAAGYRYGIYSNQNWYVNRFAKHIPVGAFFWLADLEGDPNFKCDFHQYSFTGKVNGIKGNVDLDYDLREAETKPAEEPKKSTEEMAKEVIAGKWGNGEERKDRLTKAGYDYSTIQKRVNELVAESKPALKSVDEVAKEVIAGKWGNGDERKTKLEEAGYNYRLVQDKVNTILKPTTKAVSPAKSRDDSIAGTYVVTAAALNCRYIPGLMTTSNIIQQFKNGDVLQNYGYYTQVGNSKWYLVKKGAITGFVDSHFIKRK